LRGPATCGQNSNQPIRKEVRRVKVKTNLKAGQATAAVLD